MTSQNPNFNIPPAYAGMSLCYQRSAAGQRDRMLRYLRQEASKFGIDASNMDMFQIQAEIERLITEMHAAAAAAGTSHQTGTQGESSSRGE